MTNLVFTIQGNPEDEDGNPYGYKRMLKKHMREDARKYLAWQNYVREAFEDTYPDVWMEADEKFPLTSTMANPVRMDIIIEWASDGHRSDADNVYKGIQDSLFRNDKYVTAGSFESSLSPEGKGRVIVKINFQGDI